MFDDPKVFDRDDTLDRFDGDDDLMRQIIVCFLDDAPRQMEILRELLACGDWGRARRVAHAFRGAAANVGAAGILLAAYSLEEAACGVRPRDADNVYRGLKDEVARFRTAVVRAGLVAQSGASVEGDPA